MNKPRSPQRISRISRIKFCRPGTGGAAKPRKVRRAQAQRREPVKSIGSLRCACARLTGRPQGGRSAGSRVGPNTCLWHACDVGHGRSRPRHLICQNRQKSAQSADCRYPQDPPSSRENGSWYSLGPRRSHAEATDRSLHPGPSWIGHGRRHHLAGGLARSRAAGIARGSRRALQADVVGVGSQGARRAVPRRHGRRTRGAGPLQHFIDGRLDRTGPQGGSCVSRRADAGSAQEDALSRSTIPNGANG